MARNLKRYGKPLFPNRRPKLVELRDTKIRWSIFNPDDSQYPACLAAELAAVTEQIATDQGVGVEELALNWQSRTGHQFPRNVDELFELGAMVGLYEPGSERGRLRQDLMIIKGLLRSRTRHAPAPTGAKTNEITDTADTATGHSKKIPKKHRIAGPRHYECLEAFKRAHKSGLSRSLGSFAESWVETDGRQFGVRSVSSLVRTIQEMSEYQIWRSRIGHRLDTVRTPRA
jgi:hypothetical protein